MGLARTRATGQRRGVVAVAAIGLLLGLGIAAPAGAQDGAQGGGDSYTTSSPTDRDRDGNGIPDDIENDLLGSGLENCSPGSYTVGEPFTLEVPGPVDANASFVLNQYSQSLRLFVGTAPSGSVEVTSPLAGEHTMIFYGVDADGDEAAAGCISTGIEVGGQSQPNPPDPTGDTTGSPSGGSPAGSTGSPSTGSTGGGSPGGAGTPLARTGFGAALPSLVATALVVGGGLLTITVARRRRNR